jgi:hypothetical protein
MTMDISQSAAFVVVAYREADSRTENRRVKVKDFQ